MFKLGETYYTKAGYKALIICDDARYKTGLVECPFVALLEVPTGLVSSGRMAIFYNADGKYIGVGHAQYDLVSNEPNAEEAKLMEDIFALTADTDLRDGDVRLLKIIRQLRKK